MLNHRQLSKYFNVEHFKHALTHFVPRWNPTYVIKHWRTFPKGHSFLNQLYEGNAAKVHIRIVLIKGYVAVDTFRGKSVDIVLQLRCSIKKSQVLVIIQSPYTV